MPEEITLPVIAERLANYHQEVRGDLVDIKGKLIDIGLINVNHERRISFLEGRQGMIVKIVLSAMAGGGMMGGIGFAASKFMGA